MSCRDIIVYQLSRESRLPVETFTEGEAAEELISLVSKSAHAGTEEKVVGLADI